ncbi:type II secretion system minor pseudopilin GspK [Tateyamaria sp. syn59]|uniref:type II secretion system minor pseudopilin GspK n=1 Tax=Tateyamaria sp. syn59 TaxID=2576942 RepID=UPI0011BE748D|nr:type II secretion system minor pseudopilin GspK [Tateyamaria sp. syn59]
MRGADRSDGFVIVNALVLLAAMSAVAVLLLSRAEQGRARLALAQTSETLRDNLDAFDALSRLVLDRDQVAGRSDSARDAWADTIDTVSLAQGTVSGRITDQQGLFNINWLADPNDTVAQDGFDALTDNLGASPGVAEAIVAFVSRDGPANTAAYRALTPAMAPLGGAALTLSQLDVIPDVSDGDLDLLRPYITVLPPGTRLNVNTAPERVLRAMLPQLSERQVLQVLRQRADEPFPTLEDFILATGLDTDLEENPQAVDAGRLDVGSSWFQAEATATVDTREASRVTLFKRSPAPTGTEVFWRLTHFGDH